MARCVGLTYNGWLYLMPRRVLDQLIVDKHLRPCTKHRDRLMMTKALHEAAERGFG